MKSLELSIFIFKILCGIAAVVMIGYWIFKFNKNDDVSAIEYISYETHSDIVYPELSICFISPFTSPILFWSSSGNISATEYEEYINGKKIFREEYTKIDFYDVTLDIFEYVEHIHIYMRNQIIPEPLICQKLDDCPYVRFKNSFDGFFNGWITRCFGFDVNSKMVNNVNSLYVLFKKDLNIMLDRFSKYGSGQIFLVLNYPGQMLKNPGVWKSIWKNGNDSNGLLSVKVSINEILRRRNKRKDPCFVDWTHFDDTVLKTHHDAVGCSPPYHKSSKPVCTLQKEIMDSRYELNEIRNRYIPPPCEEMSSIAFSAEHLEISKNSKNFEFYYNYPDKTKVIQQVKAVDFQTLIGNIGGYIGLLLGNMNAFG